MSNFPLGSNWNLFFCNLSSNVTKMCYRTHDLDLGCRMKIMHKNSKKIIFSVPVSEAECDIRMNFDTNEYPNIFVSRK